MIAVKLEGRLGNQLFQYAFAYASAKKLKTRFYLDKSIDPLLLPQYFDIERDFCAFLDDRIFSVKGYKNLFSFYARRNYYRLLQQLLRLKPITFLNEVPAAVQLQLVQNGLIYAGFFQSEQYFAAVKEVIRKQFRIKEKYQLAFRSVFNSLPQNPVYVCVHVRRGDYVDLKLGLQLAYYHNAIKSVHSADNFYIFISDDPDFITNEFTYIDKKYLSRNHEIIDFQFLTVADICILSNSSFSWWGAWLNNKAAKQVIAPEFWLGQDIRSELPVGIIQPEWQTQ